MSSGNPHLARLEGPVSIARSSVDALQAQARNVAADPFVRKLLEALDGGTLVLNQCRQVVVANLRDITASPDEIAAKAFGLRPGELFRCTHATENTGGCGATEACRSCGALRAVVGSQRAQVATEDECLISVHGRPGALELRVRATPLEVAGERFTLLVIRDVSDEKRRRALEQIFFHDIANSLTSLSVWSQLLLTVPAERLRETSERVAMLVERLEGEIRDQRALLHAEEGTLELEPQAIDTHEVLRRVGQSFAEHPLTRGRSLQVEAHAAVTLETDRSLLIRVLSNMVVNALEATSPGGTVRLGCRAAAEDGWAAAFQVQNDAVIPPEVAPHVFQRSFSTKGGRGRGLGTYGMKLLGERYLEGKVSFTSREGEGTVFRLALPQKPTRTSTPR